MTAAGPDQADVAYHRFIRALHSAALAELDAALPGIPCASLYRPRAEARARRTYEARLRRAEYQFLFERKAVDV